MDNDNTSVLEGVLSNLFETISDKDEKVRNTVESSLVKIAEKRPDDTFTILAEYRCKHPKLSDQTVAVLLRVIESVKLTKVGIKNKTLEKIIELAINEITKAADNSPAIQRPALEILVSIGRQYCDMVMGALISHTPDGSVPHFMILYCMGTLATANIQGSTPFFKIILASIIPNLGSVKLDHVKQAHAFVIGRFSEALLDGLTNAMDNPSNDTQSYSVEFSVAYDVLLNQWLNSREPKVCSEILHALSSMYPLLPSEKIQDQASRLIPNILHLYRRSIDRNAITQFLASVLKTNISMDSTSLDTLADLIVTQLFDLVCVYPDYEKPQTIKGHYEVLRCFHLLAPIYSSKIIEMLLIHLRSNSERERIKSLLVVTHLINSSGEFIESKIYSFVECLKQMILVEKSIKMKMTLLKVIVALAQKSLLKDKEFIWFIVRHSCKYTKINSEHGSADEHKDFMQTCQNSLNMLSSTVCTVDNILKRELLSYFCMLDYTDIANIIVKCLANLLSKSVEIELDVNNESGSSSPGDENNESKAKTVVPSPEAIFARCITLMGNFRESSRISNILNFLKFYYWHLNPDLKDLWDHEIQELQLSIGREKLVLDTLYDFITKSVEFLNEKDHNFAERLTNKLADQFILYPINTPHSDFEIPPLHMERGMLIKAIGLCLCHIKETQTIDSKFDLIVVAAKQEKLDKHISHSDYEHKLVDAAQAIGFMSKAHLQICLKKLNEMAHFGNKKHSVGFFSNLHFMKDSHKEIEMYKMNLLVFESYGKIIEIANPSESLKDIDTTMIPFLLTHLTETKDQTMKKVILNTLLNITTQFLKNSEYGYELKTRNEIEQTILNIPIEGNMDNLLLFPLVLKLGANILRIENDDPHEGGVMFEISCKNFFSCAQNLKTKFDSIEEDENNSYLAQYLNQSLPELNSLVKIMIESDPSPACLDLVISILEGWVKHKNSEVRICAGHVLNNCLDVYIKFMKIGCEQPSKFNQTGQMLGKIIPRCIDSNATVRQTSVDILQKTLEISCIYETLTIPDSSTDWVRDIEKIRDTIITDDPKEIYCLAGDIAKIVAYKMSNFQYLQFCKTLLNCLNDPETSSAIGASVVLKFFIQQKGAELFHCIPDMVKDCLNAIRNCNIERARSGVQKGLVALTKHHPKLVCNEILNQPLPFDDCIVEYWNTICSELELTEIILENFLQILSSSCLYEQNENGESDRQRIATIQPFAIFCALKEIFPSKEIQSGLKKMFPDLFAMLLTSLATYINLAPPLMSPKSSPVTGKTQTINNKSRFGFVPNKEAVKMVPCQIVLDAFKSFLSNLEMEQIGTVLTVCPNLGTSTDLGNFIELLTPMAVGVVNQFTMGSSTMRQIVVTLSKYVSSPYDGQRVAAVGLFSQLVPLKPCGEISSVIMLHLSSALSDPNPTVRGLSIRGLAFVGNLTDHDIEKYTETAITALLKGIDDYNTDCLINIPLESKRGLSRIFQTLSSERVESFHISLAIRIRPFFENSSTEIREAAILLFGDLCESKMLTQSANDLTSSDSSEALKEQLFANLFSLLLHLSETDPTIIRACKVTLRKVCCLINAPKVNDMAQKHLLDHGQLNYNIFIVDFVKLIGTELKEHIQDFIESCIPFLRSHWSEIRGNATIVIGVLHNYLPTHNQHNELVGHKIAVLLKDENVTVRHKAAAALGYFFGNL
ncbi:maestro heat-like repeat-containing protein family member 1 [Condylostylus longicornis]|uniref:maestro heat-like repeat-containing protein family member 1 n=1 Tax=Condylostylus longicornis TaxID=2530218 RepID=UPI00244DB2C9|nr:maestro heat-like repeat-containing protein family member 1 [Condylostylus longicornis]